jgi:general secretion pathway protein K
MKPCGASRPSRKGEQGAALLIVLWTCAVLAALAGEFAIAMRREAESAANFKQEALARYTAIAAINEAILSVDAFNGKVDSTEENPDDSKHKLSFHDQDEEHPGLKVIRTLIEGRGEWVQGHLYGAAYPDYEVRAVDETGKIALNAGEVNENVLQQILLNLGYDDLTASIVSDSILDWRDDDDLHRAEGAEDDYYRGLDRPYPCKDAPFDSIEELLLVRGVTRAMYYGHDGIPGLRDIFTTAQDRPRLTPRTVSDRVEWALCGDPEMRGNGLGKLDDRAKDQRVLDIRECLQGTGLSVARNDAKAQLGYATIEARVKDPHVQDRIVAHVGAQVQFKGNGGFETVQWYDSIFDE